MSTSITRHRPTARALLTAFVLVAHGQAQEPTAGPTPVLSIQVVALSPARTADEAVRRLVEETAAVDVAGARFLLPDPGLAAAAETSADARSLVERAIRGGRAIAVLGGGGGGFGGAVDSEAHARALSAGERFLRQAGVPSPSIARASAAVLADPMATLRFRSAGVRTLLMADEDFSPTSVVRSSARWSRRTGPDGNHVVVHRAFTMSDADFDARALRHALKSAALAGGPAKLVVCPPRGSAAGAASRLLAKIKDRTALIEGPVVAVEPFEPWLTLADAAALLLPETVIDPVAGPEYESSASSRPGPGGAPLAAVLKAAEVLAATGALLVESPEVVDLSAAWTAVAGDADPAAMERAGRAAARAAESGLRALAATTIWRLGAQYVDAVAAPPGAFIVANPTAFVVTEGVVMPLFDDEAALDLDVRDGGGKIVPSQRVVRPSGPAIAFVAFKLPPFGVKSYQLARKTTSSTPAATDPARTSGGRPTTTADPVLENEFLRAVVDRRSGDIRSLTAKPTGREILGPGGLRFLPTRGGPDGAAAGGPESEAKDARDIRIVENGPVRTVLRISGLGRPVLPRVPGEGVPIAAPRIEVDYVLWRASPRLDVVVSSAGGGRELLSAELAGRPSAVLVDVPGGRFARCGSDHGRFGRRVAGDFADGRYGLTLYAAEGAVLLAEGALLRAIDEATGATGAIGATGATGATDGGSAPVVRRYALLPRDARIDAAVDPEAEFGRLFAAPLIFRVRPEERGEEGHPVLHERAAELGRGVLASLEDEDATIAAIKRADDGRGIVVRIVSARQERGRRDVRLSFPFDVVRAESTDLREGAGTALPVTDRRTVTISIHGADFATVRIVPAP